MQADSKGTSHRCLARVLLVAGLGVWGAAMAVAQPRFDDIQSIVVFGDSFSDAGRQNGTVNTSPPEVLWVDYLADRLGVNRAQPNDSTSQPTGLNFAHMGATAASVGRPFPSGGEQVDSYLDTVLGGGTIPDDALLVVWLGMTDLFDAQAITPSEAAQAVRVVLNSLVAAGGRQFLLPDALPLGLMPEYADAAAAASARAAEFNTLLAGHLGDLRESHPEVVFRGLDTGALFQDMVNEPDAYGLSDVTRSAFFQAGSDPAEYLWWDLIHPTSVAHEALADFTLVTAFNLPPVANAGANVTVSDDDDSGSEAVTLDGSGSTDERVLVSYVWSENGVPIATGPTPTYSFEVGVHRLTLTVMDDQGVTGSDEVDITVQPFNAAPVAYAGSDRTVVASDNSELVSVTLDGSASSDNEGITAYSWTVGGVEIATGATPTVDLAVGTHTVRLTVWDAQALEAFDEVTVVVEAYNAPPAAVAGPDLAVQDADGSGSEMITLDGSASSDDGTIVSYVWTRAGQVLATGINPAVNLNVGEHTLLLRVTDDRGATASDELVVVVDPRNGAPTAVAGVDLRVVDRDFSGTELVSLDGSASSDDVGIQSYRWSLGGTVIAEGARANVSLAPGRHHLSLTVSDEGGLTSTDEIVVAVQSPGDPVAGDVAMRLLSAPGTAQPWSLHLEGPPMGMVVLEASSDLVNWTHLQTLLDFDGEEVLPITPDNNGLRFFRLR